MATTPESSGREPPQSASDIAQLVYALHALSIIVGLVGAASVVGSFIGSVPSIIAVILNYLKRGDARGTWVDSHFRWQIRTFWFAALWVLIAFLLIVTLIGIPIAIAILIAITFWLIYRIARGWLRFRDRRAMYV